MEKTTLSTRALEFLVNLNDSDASEEESMGILCVLAEELQSGATAGATIIYGCSATFDKVVFPSLPSSCFDTLHNRIAPPYVGTCAQAVCEERT
jgi:hypothetical protein